MIGFEGVLAGLLTGREHLSDDQKKIVSTLMTDDATVTFGLFGFILTV